MNCDDVKPQLSAYLDGELTANESLAIERHLDGCPNCLAALDELRSLSGVLSQARFEAPESLRRSLEAKLEPKKPAFALPRLNVWAFGAVAGLVFAFFIGRMSVHPASLANDLLASHTRSLIGTHLIDVESSDRHTVKPWFIGKIDYSPTPYDLKEQGFELKGGRLDYIEGQTVPVYVYQHQKHVINLYVFKGDQSLDRAETNGYYLLRWTANGFTYVAISDVSPESLQFFKNEFLKAGG